MSQATQASYEYNWAASVPYTDTTQPDMMSTRSNEEPSDEVSVVPSADGTQRDASERATVRGSREQSPNGVESEPGNHTHISISENGEERDESEQASISGSRETSVMGESTKRRASAVLEHTPTKALKVLLEDGRGEERSAKTAEVEDEDEGEGEDEDEVEGEAANEDGSKNTDEIRRKDAGGEGSDTGSSNGLDYRAETIEGLKKELANWEGRKERFNKKFKEEKADRLHQESLVAQLQVEIDSKEREMREVRALKNGDSAQVQRKIEENLRKKWEKKMSDQEAKHDSSLKLRLETKDATHQKNLKVQKARREKAEQEARDIKAEFQEKEKERKKEHDELKKELAEHKKQAKAEIQEQIKKSKPEHNKILKERDNKIKEQQKMIDILNKSVQDAGTEQGNMQASVQSAERQAQKAKRDLESLKSTFKKNETFHQNVGSEYAALNHKLKDELEFEGRRWAKQRECYDNEKTKLVLEQRSNGVLRQTTERYRKQIAGLEQRLSALGPEEGKPANLRKDSVQIGTQTEGLSASNGQDRIPGFKAGEEKQVDDKKEFMRTDTQIEGPNGADESESTIALGGGQEHQKGDGTDIVHKSKQVDMMGVEMDMATNELSEHPGAQG